MSDVPKSTPGPWIAGSVLKKFSGAQARQIESEHELIGLVYGVHDEDNAANARLIAAAPELAEALRELHDFAVSDTHYRHLARSERAFERAAELLERVGY